MGRGEIISGSHHLDKKCVEEAVTTEIKLTEVVGKNSVCKREKALLMDDINCTTPTGGKLVRRGTEMRLYYRDWMIKL